MTRLKGCQGKGGEKKGESFYEPGSAEKTRNKVTRHRHMTKKTGREYFDCLLTRSCLLHEGGGGDVEGERGGVRRGNLRGRWERGVKEGGVKEVSEEKRGWREGGW